MLNATVIRNVIITAVAVIVAMWAINNTPVGSFVVKKAA